MCSVAARKKAEGNKQVGRARQDCPRVNGKSADRKTLSGDQQLHRRAHRRKVDVDGVLDAARVASRHRDGNGYPGGLTQLEHEAVTGRQALLRYGEPPETVTLERIGAGQINGKIRL